MTVILGIDESHRGPVIGSLIVAGVLVDTDDVKGLGIKDSKELSPTQIHNLAQTIYGLAKSTNIVVIPALAISTGENLNDIECKAFCDIAKNYYDVCEEVHINNFDRSRNKFIQRANRLGFNFNWKQWTMGHNNESKDLPVGAASILAKHNSLKDCMSLTDMYGDFGSGNPNDPKTEEFVRKHLDHDRKACSTGCSEIRWTWSTIERLRNERDERQDAG